MWGNCQAAPLGDLLRAPLAALGLEVVDLPPVYLLTRAQVADVHALLADAALLVSQPIRDEYRVPGCATATLAGLLPPTGRLVTVPLTYYSGSLPFQVTANGAGGDRIAAPRTDYHDLRLLAAAERGESAAEVLADWPRQAPGDAVRRHAESSLAELQQREAACDITVSDLVAEPGAMFTLNHPRNAVLAEVARRILAVVEPDAPPVDVPEREYLGSIRTPLEGASAWTIDGADVPWDVVITEHLAWYRTRPDVVRDGLARNAARRALLLRGTLER